MGDGGLGDWGSELVDGMGVVLGNALVGGGVLIMNEMVMRGCCPVLPVMSWRCEGEGWLGGLEQGRFPSSIDTGFNSMGHIASQDVGRTCSATA